MRVPELTMVIGGAASGKSRFGETLIRSAEGRPVYIATAQALDAEMQAKIARHKSWRDATWQLIEAPLDLATALGRATSEQVVLVDCATMWLSNHLLAEHDIETASDGLLAALAACAAPVVVVTNEMGLSVVPENALARHFREAQGRLNQRLAAQSNLVVNVIAGLPQVLKGHMP